MKQLARFLRKNQTDTERKLWQRLRGRQLRGFKFRRQYPIAPYVVDFVCIDRRLVVECDGGQHGVMVEADAARTKYLNGRGYRVMRFWDNEALLDIDAVLSAILEALNDPHPRPLPQAGEGTLR